MDPMVLSLPDGVEMFSDARGGQRCMRVTWHHAAGLVVVSLWRDDICVGTLRLPREDVPRLVHALTEGLEEPSPDRDDSAHDEAC